MGKEEILEKVYETAKAYELKNGNCAQCTIAAIFEILGVEDEGVFRAATGLADGVGLTGDGHCGALSGGTMARTFPLKALKGQKKFRQVRQTDEGLHSGKKTPR